MGHWANLIPNTQLTVFTVCLNCFLVGPYYHHSKYMSYEGMHAYKVIHTGNFFMMDCKALMRCFGNG